MRKILLSIFIAPMIFPALLSAQDKSIEKRKFGLTFPNIGFIWRMSDYVAFLPDINLTHGWSDLGSSAGDNTTNTIGINAALRFYLNSWKGARFYVTPRYGYNWSNVNSTTQSISLESSLRTHSVSGAWGLEYAVSDRISLYGDIGIRYSHGRTESTATYSTNSSTNSIGSAGTWGLILYLK
jgi:hypothetical protein